MITPLLLLATLASAGLSAPSAAAQDTLRTLSGRVLSEGSAAPLAFALIEVGAGPQYLATLADAEGRYRLSGVAAGRQRIRVSTLDHAPLEVFVQLPESGDVELDLILRIDPIGVAGITVVSDRAPDAAPPKGTPAARGSPGDPELRALEATPGVAELGLVDGARTEPIVDPRDPESALYVRGAASDLKLVLLDGAPVYAPFHLGGLIQAFQPGVLSSARLYAGGAPSRYDGGLSYILELNTRQGEHAAIRTSGALDLLGARTRLEGPLPGGSFLASGRLMNGAAADGLAASPLPYDYADALARVDFGLGLQHHLSATGFYNRESVDLDAAGGLNEPAHWGNSAGSLRYRGRLGERELELGAALGEFTTRLPVGIETPGVADGRSLRTRLTADLMQPLGSAQLAYGISYDRQQLEYQARATSDGALWLQRRAVADALGAYGEATWEPNERLTLRGGLRANGFLAASEVHLAPRASLAWHLSEHSTLSLAAGRYHQYVRTSETLLSGDLGAGWTEFANAGHQLGDSLAQTQFDPQAARPLEVAGASHLVLGLNHLPRQDLRLGFEAYYKAFDDAPELAGLQASGVDLWVDWSEGGWAAWAGYSLGWAWTERDTARFSARQLLSGGLRVPLPSGVRLDLSLASSSGQPYTSIPIGGTPLSREDGPDELVQTGQDDPVLAGAPDGSYLRLDGQLSKSWPARLFGIEMRFTPYVRVLNALDRRDALFYQFDSGQDLRPRSLFAVPILPVIGIAWEG